MIIDLSLPEATSRRQAVIVGFTSPVGGIGRTGVVANLAWIISSAGKRVLILDWSTEAPHVHEYLRPFYAESLPVGAILGEELFGWVVPVVLVGQDDRASIPADRHVTVRWDGAISW